MPSRHTLTVSVPLPSILPPHLVVAALQTYTPVLVHNVTIDKFETITADPSLLANDPFFAPWDDSVRAYHVWWHIELGHGLVRRWQWPVVMQYAPCGLRFRVLTPQNVHVWARFTVRPRTTQPLASDSSPTSSESTATPSPMTSVADEWELHDEIVVEGNRLYMPFVLPYAHRAHQRVCENIVDAVFKSYVYGAMPD
ncbi:hypothetical protein B0T10DRAFT_495406 [Thelonectria olida]|uniref:DUF7053 domain-containing protein n=1 Tax=Thelonectria olida TaxID=1576542 RepID=A0A9P8VWD1_9HYPO|nr:hypothetical protein B0T10DRAFT_495406 [Thelonectria olida]